MRRTTHNWTWQETDAYGWWHEQGSHDPSCETRHAESNWWKSTSDWWQYSDPADQWNSKSAWCQSSDADPEAKRESTSWGQQPEAENSKARRDMRLTILRPVDRQEIQGGTVTADELRGRSFTTRTEVLEIAVRDEGWTAFLNAGFEMKQLLKLPGAYSKPTAGTAGVSSEKPMTPDGKEMRYDVEFAGQGPWPFEDFKIFYGDQAKAKWEQADPDKIQCLQVLPAQRTEEEEVEV